MNLNKVLILTLIVAVLLLNRDALTFWGKQQTPPTIKVQDVVDEKGVKVQDKIDVMEQGRWVRFAKSNNACTNYQPTEGKESAQQPKYQYATDNRSALNVIEDDGTCRLYIREKTLTDDEKGIIALEMLQS